MVTPEFEVTSFAKAANALALANAISGPAISGGWFTIKRAYELSRVCAIPSVAGSLNSDVRLLYAATSLYQQIFVGSGVLKWGVHSGKMAVLLIRSLAVGDDGLLFELPTAEEAAATLGADYASEPIWTMRNGATAAKPIFSDAVTELEKRLTLVDRACAIAAPGGVVEEGQSPPTAAGVDELRDEDKIMRVCLTVAAVPTPGLLEFATAVFETGSATAFVTYCSYFLRALYKPAGGVVRYNREKQSILRSWAGIEDLPAFPDVLESSLSFLATASRGLIASVTHHVVVNHLMCYERYDNMKKWFALRAEWAGQTMINLFVTIAAVGPLFEILRSLATDWNEKQLARISYSYAVYGLGDTKAFTLLSALTDGVVLVDAQDSKAGKFARCYSTSFHEWNTIRAMPRLSALLLGLISTTISNGTFNDMSCKDEFRAGQLLGEILFYSDNSLIKVYDPKLQAAYAQVAEERKRAPRAIPQAVLTEGLAAPSDILGHNTGVSVVTERNTAWPTQSDLRIDGASAHK